MLQTCTAYHPWGSEHANIAQIQGVLSAVGDERMWQEGTLFRAEAGESLFRGRDTRQDWKKQEKKEYVPLEVHLLPVTWLPVISQGPALPAPMWKHRAEPRKEKGHSTAHRPFHI